MMKTQRNNAVHRGFTLLEIMVVLFILATLMGMAVLSFLGTRDVALIDSTYTYVKFLEGQVKLYDTNNGRPPTTEQGLQALVVQPTDLPNPARWGGPYLESNASDSDPWGNKYQYASPGRDGRSFEIWSFGPNGIEGDDDDIGSWMPKP